MENIQPIRILMADDDADDRYLTKEAFKENHLLNDLRFVENGEELIDYLFQRGQFNAENAPRPGIILLDLNMPKIDGRQALEIIKREEALRSIPVIILTTSSSETDIVKSYDLGVNSFISKPVTFDELINVVKELGKYWFGIVELPKN